MSSSEPGNESPVDGTGADASRSGPTVEDAVARAEQGTDVEGAHTAFASPPPGGSRIEQAAGISEMITGHTAEETSEAAAPPPGLSPRDMGSGGGQDIVGGRISDRVAGNQPTPDVAAPGKEEPT